MKLMSDRVGAIIDGQMSLCSVENMIITVQFMGAKFQKYIQHRNNSTYRASGLMHIAPGGLLKFTDKNLNHQIPLSGIMYFRRKAVWIIFLALTLDDARCHWPLMHQQIEEPHQAHQLLPLETYHKTKLQPNTAWRARGFCRVSETIHSIFWVMAVGANARHFGTTS